MFAYVHIYEGTHGGIYSKTSLNRPIIGPILSVPFSEVVGLRISKWAIVWDPNKTIDVGEWSICGDFTAYVKIYIYIYIYIYIADKCINTLIYVYVLFCVNDHL